MNQNIMCMYEKVVKKRNLVEFKILKKSLAVSNLSIVNKSI